MATNVSDNFSESLLSTSVLSPPLIPVVAYLRMSTEMQDCSIEHQRAYIQRFAAKNGFVIIREYIDEACTGTAVEYRPSFQQMVAEIEAGNADFEAVLVYDMSRFGRFQIETEGPYYQHKLRMQQIRLIQCTKEYRPKEAAYDGLINYLEMIDAGRFSSDLSRRVSESQKRFISLGFKQGGVAGFGLRRVQVDGQGKQRHEGKFMERRQRKDYPTDRVVLALGPAEQIEWVRWMYNQVFEHKKHQADIAAELNAKGIRSDSGRPWTADTVLEILTNEKYIGNLVYNRVSSGLEQRVKGKVKSVRNPPEQWVRCPKAFPAIIDDTLFEQVQGILKSRSRKLWQKDEMLAKLRELYRNKGILSGLLIEEAIGLPPQSAYRRQFGSLTRAYLLVGFTPNRDYSYLEINKHLRRMFSTVWQTVKNTITGYGIDVVEDTACDLLTINDEFTVSLIIARCQQHDSDRCHWLLRFDTGLRPDYTVAVRMNQDNETIRDYYILPITDVNFQRLHLAEHNGALLDSYRCDSLDRLFDATRNVTLTQEAA